MNIKGKVLLVIAREVANAKCNVLKAEHKFRNFGPKQMDTQYGHSGDTCQEILDKYKNAAADAQLQLDWVNSREA